jgi:hypothetical protein
LNFFVGNDLADNARPGLLRVVDGELVDGEVPRGFLPLLVRGFLFRHSHLYHLLWPYQRMLVSGRDAIRSERRKGLAAYGPAEVQADAKVWHPSERWIAEVATIARTHEVPAALVLIPDPLQVDASRFGSLLADLGLAASDYDRHQPDARLTAFAQAQGMPVLDLLPSFDATSEPAALYFRLDQHWTPAGHELAAAHIARFLTAERLVRSRP